MNPGQPPGRLNVVSYPMPRPRRPGYIWTPPYLCLAVALALTCADQATAQVVVRQVIIGGQAQPVAVTQAGVPGQPQPGQPPADTAPAGPAVHTIEGERIPGRPIALQDGHLLLPTEPIRRIPLHDVDRVEFAGLAELTAHWLGQDGPDFVQPGAAVGPNGVPDIHIRLSGLAFDTPVKQIVLACHNPTLRSVWRLDPARTPNWKLHLEQLPGTDVADIYVEPDAQDAFGHDFTLTVLYQDNRVSRTRFKAATHTSNAPPGGTQQAAASPAAQTAPGSPSGAVRPPSEQPAAGQAAAEQSSPERSAPPTGGQPSPEQAGEVMVHGQGPLKLRGRLVQMTDTSLTLTASWGGELTIPLREARALQWLASSTPDALEKFQTALANPAVEDTLLVRGRDQAVSLVRGTASGFSDGRLQFGFEGTSGNIAQSRLVGLVFAAGPPQPAAREPFQLVVLATGDQLPGVWTGLSEDTLELTTAWGQRAVVPTSIIAQVQFRNGRLVYLSDLEPAEVEEFGYFGRTLAYRRDQALDGGPLRLAGKTYRKGLAVHARSVLSYDLDGPYAAFRTLLGFSDSAAEQGRVAVRILGDGRELLQQPDFRAVDDQGKRSAPLAIEVPLHGVKRLTLEVDFGEHEDVGDRLIWADARLYRAVDAGQTTGSEGPPP